MAMNRDEFVTEICDVVGKSGAATSVSGATLQTRVRTYINWGQKRIARSHNFHELNVLQTTAATVTSVQSYPMSSGTNNLGLTRPKDILSIRLIDSENSRILTRWHYRKFDRHYPYPTNYTTGRPSIYCRRGNSLEMFRIPNAAYTLYIFYPQWPSDLATGTQSSDFTNKDQLILAAGVLETYLALEEYADVKVWYQRFLGHLGDAIAVEGDVDWEPEAEPHGHGLAPGSGTPWIDPYGGVGDPLYGYAE